MVPAVVKTDRRLSAWDLRVLLAVLELSVLDKRAGCLVAKRISAGGIARMLEEGGPSAGELVRRALRRLAAFGYLKRVGRAGEEGTFDANPTWGKATAAAVVGASEREGRELPFAHYSGVVGQRRTYNSGVVGRRGTRYSGVVGTHYSGVVGHHYKGHTRDHITNGQSRRLQKQPARGGREKAAEGAPRGTRLRRRLEQLELGDDRDRD